ncbi:MAG: L-histidine N(alpha)-methyltransferase [Gemmatimonadota bacterium]|nr:L-histidine N(alpha)-methyltransferase [Gemmatimonadota bacterium]
MSDEANTENHDARIVIRNLLHLEGSPYELAEDARRGLTSSPKWMPPKYFYDARGSELFERITAQPEYYQTSTELEILQRIAPLIVDRVRPTALIEFGSGSASKTRVLLDEMRRAGQLGAYGMLDVSEAASRAAAVALVATYPRLEVECVIADFEQPQPLPFPGRRRLLAFLGSTIGNFEVEAAQAFLRGPAERMRDDDAFLIGFDLVKDRETIERAYNDAAGVTEAFNRNLLMVLNRELGADFDPSAFDHKAFYNESASRIEMHLVAKRAQSVRVTDLDMTVEFAPGETLRTELSHKYTRRSVEALLEAGNLALDMWETDPDQKFALGLARRR